MSAEEKSQPEEARAGQEGHAKRRAAAGKAGRDAKRPRETRGPLVGDHRLGWWDTTRVRSFIDARTARVFVTRSGQRLLFGVDAQPTVGELVWRRVVRVYEVDTGTHTAHVSVELPSRGDLFAFRADIDLVWRAVDPLTVVAKGVSSVREVLTPQLLARLRALTRKFDIDQADQAEQAAESALAASPIGCDLGLEVQAYVRLTMDDPTLEHAATKRRTEQFKEIIEQGDYQQFALQLAMRPEQVDVIIKELVRERDSSRAAVFDFVTKLLETDALERWQVEDHVRVALQWVSDSHHKVLTGTDEARAVRFAADSATPGAGSRT